MDYLLSDPFMGGVICTVFFLLLLVTVVPMFTRRPHPYQSQEWHIVEPADQITTVTAKRIEAKR